MGHIVAAVVDGIATATISAPPMNALNAAMRAELAEHIQRFEDDNDVRVIVLRGDGPKAFCAGFDITEIILTLGSAERTRAQLERDAGLFDRLAHCPKPTMAIVEGLALGGGLELAICCDFILAGEGARFGLPEIKLGAIPVAGGTLRVMRLIGPSRARQMMLLGDPVDAATALAWGLITRVVPQSDLARESAAFERRLADAPALAIQYAKRAMDAALEVDEAEALAVAREGGARLATSADLATGVRAFSSRQAPSFRDKADPEK
jgi:enoyl-CoA hydratase/carnithine racemase